MSKIKSLGPVAHIIQGYCLRENIRVMLEHIARVSGRSSCNLKDSLNKLQ